MTQIIYDNIWFLCLPPHCFKKAFERFPCCRMETTNQRRGVSACLLLVDSAQTRPRWSNMNDILLSALSIYCLKCFQKYILGYWAVSNNIVCDCVENSWDKTKLCPMAQANSYILQLRITLIYVYEMIWEIDTESLELWLVVLPFGLVQINEEADDPDLFTGYLSQDIAKIYILPSNGLLSFFDG